MISVVTGGAGFIGSHLVDSLVKLKHKVIVIDNFSNGKIDNLKKSIKKIKVIKADIRFKNKKWMKCLNKADYVFHLAALADIVPSITEPRLYFDTNVVGTFNILDSLKKNKKVKLVYTASSSCYGISKIYPTSEETNCTPEYPYALSKYQGEQLILHWHKVYKIKAFSVRLFNVYGERSRTSGSYGAVFGVFLSQKINKKPFTVVGNGSQKRDFTYVKDVVDAIIKVSTSKYYGQIFNVGSGKSVSINKIVKLLGGKKIFIPKRPGEPDITYANIGKIKNKLKWKPKTNIEEGIKFLLNNINDWKKAPLWDKKSISKATKKWFEHLKI